MREIPDRFHDLWRSAGLAPANDDEDAVSPQADGVFQNLKKAALAEIVHGFDFESATGRGVAIPQLFARPSTRAARKARAKRLQATRERVLQGLVANGQETDAVLLSLATMRDIGCYLPVVTNALSAHNERRMALKVVNMLSDEENLALTFATRLGILRGAPTLADVRFLRRLIRKLVRQNPLDVSTHIQRWFQFWQVTRDECDLEQALEWGRRCRDSFVRLELYTELALATGKMLFFSKAFQVVQFERRRSILLQVAVFFEKICACAKDPAEPSPEGTVTATFRLTPGHCRRLLEVLSEFNHGWAFELRRRLLRDGMPAHALWTRP